MSTKHLNLFLLVFFCLWVLQAIFLAYNNSPTFDESIHFEAGLRYLKGDFTYDPIEPPLLRVIVASLTTSLPSHQPLLLFIPRLVVSIINGLLLVSILYLALHLLRPRSIFSFLFLASVLLLTEGSLGALGPILPTDATSQFLIVFFLLLAYRKRDSHSVFLTLLLATFTSILLCTKFVSAVYFTPLILLMFRQRLTHLPFFLLTTLFLVWAFFGFTWGAPFTDGPVLPAGHFLRLIKENLQFASRGQALYFLGRLYHQGPWFKQPLVFLMKTSPILITLASLTLFQKRHPLFLWFLGLISWVMLVNLITSLHFGIRHLLVINLLLVILAASITATKSTTKLLLATAVTLHLFFYAASLPQPLTYTSPLIGAPHLLLSDSDFDWGQGLVELARVSQRASHPFQLAYFGNNDPADFLGDYQRLQDVSPRASNQVMPIDYSLDQYISITCYYYCGYNRDKMLLKKHSEVVAHSFLHFYD